MRKVLATSLCMLFAFTARAELNIEITEGVSEAVPIAIVPFRWDGDGSAPFDVAGIIDADLEGSGRFAPVDRGDMLDSPSTSEEIDFDDWRLLDTDVIVIGSLANTGDDNYSITFEVFDIFRQQRLVGFEIPANRSGLRRASHKVADLIYEALTGVKGAFSTRVVYVSVIGARDDSTYQLVLADIDGENQTVILESPWPIMSPSWSPDGKRLAYVSFENDHSAVYVQVLRNGSRTRVADEDGINGAPAWSPDGDWLALTLSRGSGNLDIFTLSLDDFRMIRVTDNPAIDTEAVWSPGGNSLLFTSDRSGGPQVYRVNIQDGEPISPARRISFEGAYNARPRISPECFALPPPTRG